MLPLLAGGRVLAAQDRSHDRRRTRASPRPVARSSVRASPRPPAGARRRARASAARRRARRGWRPSAPSSRACACRSAPRRCRRGCGGGQRVRGQHRQRLAPRDVRHVHGLVAERLGEPDALDAPWSERPVEMKQPLAITPQHTRTAVARRRAARGSPRASTRISFEPKRENGSMQRTVRHVG